MFSCICKNSLPAYSSTKITKIEQFFQCYDHKCIAAFLKCNSVVISTSLSISIASGALMARACHLNHLSVTICLCVCVCVCGMCIVAKQLIGSGCHLGW